MEDTMIFTVTSTAEVALFNEPFIFQFFVYEYQTPNYWAVNHFWFLIHILQDQPQCNTVGYL